MKAALGFLFVVAMPFICSFSVKIATLIVDTLFVVPPSAGQETAMVPTG
jgi:hypothetical protein